MAKPGLVTITGMGKHVYVAMIVVILFTPACIILYENPAFTVHYPLPSFAAFMLFSLSFPFLISQESRTRTKQQARLSHSAHIATILNEEWRDLVQAKVLAEIITCPVCHSRLISDTHYQLCTACKQQYGAEIQRVRTQKYRAREAGMPATLTVVEWIQTLQKFHFLCAYCQQSRFQVMEHIMPVIHGGGTTQENCVPACHKCNGHKSSKHPEK